MYMTEPWQEVRPGPDLTMVPVKRQSKDSGEEATFVMCADSIGSSNMDAVAVGVHRATA